MTPADTLNAQVIWEPYYGNEVIRTLRFNQTVIANDIWIIFSRGLYSRSPYLELRGCDLEGKN
jgi:hypothetical protein